MKQQPTKLVTYASIAAVIGLSVGCATTQEVEALKQRLESVESTASQAATTAERAQTNSEAAMAAAEDSGAVAEESQACCRANTEKMNRMFDEVQRK